MLWHERFSTVFTISRHLSLSLVRRMQFAAPLYPSFFRSVLILFFNVRLGLPSGLSHSCVPTNTVCSSLLHVRRMPPLIASHIDNFNDTKRGARIMKLPIMNLSTAFCYTVRLRCLPQHSALVWAQPVFFV